MVPNDKSEGKHFDAEGMPNVCAKGRIKDVHVIYSIEVYFYKYVFMFIIVFFTVVCVMLLLETNFICVVKAKDFLDHLLR